jgi:hypothetical protein
LSPAIVLPKAENPLVPLPCLPLDGLPPTLPTPELDAWGLRQLDSIGSALAPAAAAAAAAAETPELLPGVVRVTVFGLVGTWIDSPRHVVCPSPLEVLALSFLPVLEGLLGALGVLHAGLLVNACAAAAGAAGRVLILSCRCAMLASTPIASAAAAGGASGVSAVTVCAPAASSVPCEL